MKHSAPKHPLNAPLPSFARRLAMRIARILAMRNGLVGAFGFHALAALSPEIDDELIAPVKPTTRHAVAPAFPPPFVVQPFPRLVSDVAESDVDAGVAIESEISA